MSKYIVKNLESPRGFIGLELKLMPGMNVVDQALFREVSRKSLTLRDHLRSKQVITKGKDGNGNVRVELVPVTDLGMPRPPTLYRAQKYHFGADETVELTEHAVEELRADPYFQSLEGTDIQVRSVHHDPVDLAASQQAPKGPGGDSDASSDARETDSDESDEPEVTIYGPY